MTQGSDKLGTLQINQCNLSIAAAELPVHHVFKPLCLTEIHVTAEWSEPNSRAVNIK